MADKEMIHTYLGLHSSGRKKAFSTNDVSNIQCICLMITYPRSLQLIINPGTIPHTILSIVAPHLRSWNHRLCVSSVFGERAVFGMDACHLFSLCVLAIIPLLGGAIGVVLNRDYSGH